MKSVFPLLFLFIIASCKISNPNKTSVKKEPIKDNAELAEIYRLDQEDRSVDEIDWNVVGKKDRAREARVIQLLDSNKVRTSNDYQHAGMIFQHGKDSTAYGLAVKLLKKSIELNPKADKWLLAATIDRDLLSRNKPQIYGTQFWKVGDQPWERMKMDTTQITDAQRKEYRVETLAEQKIKLKKMNSLKISALLKEEKSIDQIIAFIKSENVETSKYNLSENAINSFGYELIRDEKKEDALKIFKLNTVLYPKSFNTFDSYGECLMLLGQKKEGIKAYKKSVELNPNNKSAKLIIDKN